MFDIYEIRAGKTDAIEKVLNDPNTPTNILNEVAKYNKSPNKMRHELDLLLIDHKNFNQETANILFDRVKKSKLNVEIIGKIMESKYFSSSMYRYLVDNCDELYEDSYKKVYNIFSRLLNDSRMNEYDCLTMVQKIRLLSFYEEDVLESRHVNRKIVDEMMKDNISMGMVGKIIKYSFVDDSILIRIAKYFFATVKGDYQGIFLDIIDHPNLTKDGFKEVVRLYKGSIVDEILNHKYCDSEVLTLINISDDIVFKKILNHRKTNSDVLISLVEHLSGPNSIVTDTKSLNGFYNEAKLNELIRSIVQNNNMNKSVADKIVAKFGGNSDIMRILKNNGYEVPNVKVMPYLNNKALTDTNKIREFFSLDGLTIENIISGLEYGDKEYIDEILLRGYDNPKLNSAIIRRISELFEYITSVETGKEYFRIVDKLLERNLSTEDLSFIVNKMRSESTYLKVLDQENIDENIVYDILDNIDSISIYPQEIKEKAEKRLEEIITNGFDFVETKSVLDQLRYNVEARANTMLWGKSGVGKSSRVFQVDPTATKLSLLNGMLPEEAIGGKDPNGKPDELCPPNWYKVVKRKCEEEPDRMHILFIDEVTNVSEKIKNWMWTLLGDRVVNGNEAWPLPENCSIVLAGNRLDESTSVVTDINGSPMSAPFHNRLASMLEVKFDMEDWKKWALEINPKTGKLRIHPLVFSFCVSHGEEVMFSDFNPENITEPFKTPRLWEKVSDVIFYTEELGMKTGRPNLRMNKEHLETYLGHNGVTDAFFRHCLQKIDMQKVENGGYTERDFKTIDKKLYALGMVLADYHGDEMSLESFIIDCLGEEYYEVYEAAKRINGNIESDMNYMGRGM